VIAIGLASSLEIAAMGVVMRAKLARFARNVSKTLAEYPDPNQLRD
jgi:hypothetical protein